MNERSMNVNDMLNLEVLVIVALDEYLKENAKPTHVFLGDTEFGAVTRLGTRFAVMEDTRFGWGDPEPLRWMGLVVVRVAAPRFIGFGKGGQQ